MATQLEDLSGLTTCFDHDRLGAFECFKFEITAERCHRHGYRKLCDQIVAVALETVVAKDPDSNIEVAKPGTSLACGASTTQAQSGSCIDASGYINGVGPLVDDSASSAA
jgi:hypothetical protein